MKFQEEVGEAGRIQGTLSWSCFLKEKASTHHHQVTQYCRVRFMVQKKLFFLLFSWNTNILNRALSWTVPLAITKLLTVSWRRSGEVLGPSFIWTMVGARGRLVVQRQRREGVVGLRSRGYLREREVKPYSSTVFIYTPRHEKLFGALAC